MMTTTDDPILMALLEDIREHPDDDTPRRAYADRLIEMGNQERGEFIHGQLTLSAISDDDPCKDALKARTSTLLREHGNEWAAPVSGPGVREACFVRGFIEVVECTTATAVGRGRSWPSAHPVRKVTLTNAAGRGSQLSACRHLRTVEWLSILDSGFDDEDLVALAQSLGFPSLTSIGIASKNHGGPTLVGDTGVLALTAASFFPSLRGVSIASDRSLSSIAVAGIARAAQNDRLRKLHLDCTQIDYRGALAVANAAGLGGLEELSLTSGRVSDQSVLAILCSPRLRNLVRVWFNYNDVTGAILSDLVDADLPQKLEYLGLNGNYFGTVDIDSIAQIRQRYPNMCLGLQNCQIPRQLQEEMRERNLGCYLDYVPKRGTRVSG